jgi:DNA replicative helicase MCM subunit Mcm2 (Cdc46/Mcm family)
MQLIVSLIIENQNGRGANIEKVVSEAIMRGIDKEELLSDIQHMKDRGEVYEPKKNEIRYAF